MPRRGKIFDELNRTAMREGWVLPFEMWVRPKTNLIRFSLGTLSQSQAKSGVLSMSLSQTKSETIIYFLTPWSGSRSGVETWSRSQSRSQSKSRRLCGSISGVGGGEGEGFLLPPVRINL